MDFLDDMLRKAKGFSAAGEFRLNECIRLIESLIILAVDQKRYEIVSALIPLRDHTLETRGMVVRVSEEAATIVAQLRILRVGRSKKLIASGNADHLGKG